MLIIYVCQQQRAILVIKGLCWLWLIITISTMGIFYKPRGSGLLWLWVMLVCVAVGEGKAVSTTYNVYNFRKSAGWNYITRISVEQPSIWVSLSLQIASAQLTAESSFSMELVGVPGDLWGDELDKKCEMGRYSEEQLGVKKDRELVLPNTLNHTASFRAQIDRTFHLQQPGVYYFVLRDCAQTLLKEGLGRSTRLDVDLQVREGEQHYSASQRHYVWWLPALMALQYLVICVLRRDKEEEGDNWAKLLLKISLWTGMFSLVFKLLGHVIYAYGNGKMYNFFEIMYLVGHGGADAALIFLLVLLSFGWTVTFLNHQDFNIYIPICTMLAFVHILLTVMNKAADHEHDKYHMFDSFLGYVMLGFRIAEFGAFVYGLIRCYRNVSERQGKIKNYLRHLGLFGLAYFGYVIVGMILVEGVQVHLQQEYLFLGVELARLALGGWLGVMAGWKYSSYRAVINNSFMEKNQKYI